MQTRGKVKGCQRHIFYWEAIKTVDDVDFVATAFLKCRRRNDEEG